MRIGVSKALLLGVFVSAVGIMPVMAAEEGKNEIAEQKQDQEAAAPVTAAAAPTVEQIQEAISTYIADITRDEGAFFIDDDATGQTRELKFDHVHEGVGNAEGYYFACVDMTDVKTGELLDIDFNIDAYSQPSEVTDVLIHKVNGKPRYNYDDKGERVPVE